MYNPMHPSFLFFVYMNTGVKRYCPVVHTQRKDPLSPNTREVPTRGEEGRVGRKGNKSGGNEWKHVEGEK